MMLLKRLLLLSVLVFASTLAVAEVMTYPFDNDLQETRFQALLSELRCPKCQNQSLAESDAPIAHDLRQKVYELLQEGKSDQEIRNYLIARYGEFISYKPAFHGSTLLLWLGPGCLLLFAMFLAYRLVSKSQRQSDSLNSDIERGEHNG